MAVMRGGHPWDLSLHFSRTAGAYTIRDNGGYESRNASTIAMLATAMRDMVGRLPHSFSVLISTGDHVVGVPSFPHLAYCRSAEQRTTIAIPDFIFTGWPETGIADYEVVVDQMLEASCRPPEEDKLFWIGNAATHPTRSTFLELAARSSRIEAVGMGWVPNSYHPNTRRLTALNAFVSIPDHCRYRYLIDLQGRGYSARLKLLLFSGRPVFVQDRPWQEFFFSRLRPMVHFIPVREDLADLEERIAWADTHPDEALAVARRGQEFAVGHLRRSHAIARLRTCLLEACHALAPSGGQILN